MRKKTLILLSDNYPNSIGEYFIDDELRVIYPFFEKIIIISSSPIQEYKEYRFIPNNAIVHTFSSKKSFGIFDLKYIIYFFQEIFYLIFKLNKKLNFLRFKIILNEIRRSIFFKNSLKEYIDSIENFDVSNAIFYSYWLDYKALSLCLLNKEVKKLTCVSRAHRWDIYFEENPAHYLPFKSFVLRNLTQTFSISSDGKNYLEKLPGIGKGKVMLSRLGKSNDFTPIYQKEDKNKFIICSCSNMAKVKRVDLIVKVISLLKTKNVTWYHFGGGKLKKEVEEFASRNIKNCEFKFVGSFENSEILEFYRNNYVDLFINLSESEGIPVSIMEAHSAAIPVIASDVGAVSEIVDENNGWLVSKNIDVDLISNIIDNYLMSSETDFLKKREASYFSWKKNYDGNDNYLKFSTQLLSYN
jgi:glycosyltransferase involved in cell wall biosynthesis